MLPRDSSDVKLSFYKCRQRKVNWKSSSERLLVYNVFRCLCWTRLDFVILESMLSNMKVFESAAEPRNIAYEKSLKKMRWETRKMEEWITKCNSQVQTQLVVLLCCMKNFIFINNMKNSSVARAIRTLIILRWEKWMRNVKIVESNQEIVVTLELNNEKLQLRRTHWRVLAESFVESFTESNDGANYDDAKEEQQRTTLQPLTRHKTQNEIEELIRCISKASATRERWNRNDGSERRRRTKSQEWVNKKFFKLHRPSPD